MAKEEIRHSSARCGCLESEQGNETYDDANVPSRIYAANSFAALSFELDPGEVALEQLAIERYSEDQVEAEWIFGHQDSGESFELPDQLVSPRSSPQLRTSTLERLKQQVRKTSVENETGIRRDDTDIRRRFEPFEGQGWSCSSADAPAASESSTTVDTCSSDGSLGRLSPGPSEGLTGGQSANLGLSTLPRSSTLTRTCPIGMQNRVILWIDAADDNLSAATETRSLDPQLLRQLLVVAQINSRHAKAAVAWLSHHLSSSPQSNSERRVIQSREHFEALVHTALECACTNGQSNGDDKLIAWRQQCFRTVLQFYSAKAALIVIFINWTNFSADQGITIQLGQRLNVPNILHTTTVLTVLRSHQVQFATAAARDSARTGDGIPVTGPFELICQQYMKDEPVAPGCGADVEGVVNLPDFKRMCADVATGFHGDINKAAGSGKSLIIEGKCIDPHLFNQLFPASRFWLAKRPQPINLPAASTQSGVVVVPFLLLDHQDFFSREPPRQCLDESVTRYLAQCRDICFCIDSAIGDSRIVNEIHTTVLEQLHLAHEAGVF